jgi:REP element-mobilizing transposase RayT
MHILSAINPSQSVSSIIQRVKSESSKWINDNRFCPFKFSWQEGYGAFSYSKSQLTNVALYIKNQQEHHQKHSFLSEYKQFLNSFDIVYDEKYLFRELM